MTLMPPQTHDAMRARWAISAVFAVFGILVGSWLPHIPDIKAAIGATDASIGGALVCSGLGAVISMQFVGSLIHRFGTRNVAVAGGVGACLGVPFLVTQTSLLGLAINLLLLGLFYGALDVGMNSHAVEVQDRLGKPIMSSTHGFFSLGGIIGGIFASIAAHFKVGGLVHLAVTSGTLLLVLAIGFPFLLRKQTIASDSAAEPTGPKFVIPRGILLLLGLLCASAFVVEGGILDWAALYIRETLKGDAAYGGIAVGSASAAMAAGRFLGDPVVRRLGNRNTVLVGGIACVIGIILAVTTPSVAVCIAGFSVTCFGLANVVPTLITAAGRVEGIQVSSGVAAVTTLGYAGFLLGPPIIGVIAHRITLGIGIGALAVLGAFIAIGARSVPSSQPVSDNVPSEG